MVRNQSVGLHHGKRMPALSPLALVLVVIARVPDLFRGVGLVYLEWQL